LVWKYPQSLPTLVTDDGILTPHPAETHRQCIKFTKAGTVTVSARVNGNFEFQVSDTGVGIPEESLPVIFDMFKTSGQLVHPRVQRCGTGALHRKKVHRASGGSIEVRKRIGTRLDVYCGEYLATPRLP
jgi:K+-sensing histidine kinase KdpD